MARAAETRFTLPDPRRVDPRETARLSALCRDCGAVARAAAETVETPRRCPLCRSPRVIAHAELGALNIAHIDCDAFYAAVEKRDRPELRDQPLIIGGGARGVVSTACYLARASGVRSAMPMFKARKLCPKAVVLKPDMAKYVAVSKQIKARMLALTPLVEPLSLDEAFLDLAGSERVHGGAPAETLARLARAIEAEVGVSVSIGLAPNKFLAKIASELDKPRGFAVIGRAEAVAFLDPQPVSLIWGVGARLEERLIRDGYRTIGALRRETPERLAARYGSLGRRLAALSHGRDERKVDPSGKRKSVSAETTFSEDLSGVDALDGQLWRLAEEVSARLKAADLSGRVVVLKLKTADFRTITRRVSLDAPTALADQLYRVSRPLLERECAPSQRFRLLGLGVAGLSSGAADGGPAADLFDPGAVARAEAERAIDQIRARFGADAIGKGRGIYTKKQ